MECKEKLEEMKKSVGFTDLTKDEVKDYDMIDYEQQKLYMEARNEGFDHNQAMAYAYGYC